MLRLLLLVLLSAFPHLSRGQETRPPELSRQLNRAEAAWRSGASVLEAKARVDLVLGQRPEDVEALKLRAQVLMAMDLPAPALADARSAVRLAPSDPEAYLLLSEAAHQAGDQVLATAALDRAAERVLKDAALHVRLSMAAEKLTLLDRAEAYARIALVVDPRLPAAYHQLARVFVLQQRPAAALEILTRGLGQSLLDEAALRQDTLLQLLLDPAGRTGSPPR